MSSAPQPSDYHDALTELPNRRLFDDRLKQALHLVGRRDSGIALILIELAGFSTAPDGTVREAARRLAAVLRKADTLARWGAAEFAVILTDVTDEAQCRIAAERLLTALDMDVAMGVSRFPADALDAAALVRNADAARGRARQLGRRHYRLYAR
ncbi:MAG TPA: GGDEF domain-containing protein [Burkholderiales bacterium]|nr:GGDEF domain-containing protein [Burkholderiales bacterium]